MSHDIEHAPELRLGSHGEWVSYLQQLLVIAGHRHRNWPVVAVDSVFGAVTEQAVHAFQTVSPVPITDVVDHATWVALYRTAAGTAPAEQDGGAPAGDEHAGHRHPEDDRYRIKHAFDTWRRVGMRFVIHDSRGQPFNGRGYVNFFDNRGTETYEKGEVDNGTMVVSEMLVPLGGELSLCLVTDDDSSQLNGVAEYMFTAPELRFTVLQHDATSHLDIVQDG